MLEASSKDSQTFKLHRTYLMIILFLITFFVYGPFLKKHYALDTYVVEANGNQGEAHIQLGRFLSGGIWNVLSTLGINTAVYQSFFTFLSICLLTFSSYLVIRLFFELRNDWDIKLFILLCLSSVVSFCHVFILHWFLFPEVVTFMMTGLVLSILAVYLLRKSGTVRWILCYILVCAAVSLYQAVGAFFVTFGMVYVGVKRAGHSIVSILKGFVAIFIVYIMAGATNILFIKWYGQTDTRTDFQYASPLQNVYGIIWSLQEKLQNTNLGSAPVYAFSLIMLFILAGSVLLLWKSSDKKVLIRILIVLTVLIIGSFTATMAPHLLTSNVDVSPRSIVALMSLPGVISLFILLQTNLLKKPIFYYLLFGFLVVFFVVNTYITYSVAKSRFATNRLDKQIAGMVFQEILKHEKETGDTVHRIAFLHDGAYTLCYPGLVCYGNFRAMGRDWTIVPLLSIVSGRSFSEVDMPDWVYDTYFKGKNWDLFSKEQILIKGDTLYLMLY